MLQPAVYNRNIFWLKHELSMGLSRPAPLIAEKTGALQLTGNLVTPKKTSVTGCWLGQ